MRLPIRYIIFAILIVLFQVLVCKHIVLGSPTDPYLDVLIYPLLLILLPINTPSALVVVLGFACGLGVDFFYSSPGVHTSALVLTAFIRKPLLNTLEPRTGYAVDDTPLQVRPSDYWYYVFSGILFFVHILMYNMISFFSFTYILDIFIKTILTFLLSMLLVGIHRVIYRSFGS